MRGFDYGNARVRAMRSRLLDARAYRDLMRAGSVEALLGALAATPLREDVEAALVRTRDLRRLDEILRRNLARTLRTVRGFYEGEARAGMDLLLARWDVRNVRTILRGKAHLAPAEEIVPQLVPAGILDDASLAELARQGGVRAVLELMLAWELPSAGAARAAWRAFPAYEATRDVSVLETALDRAWAAHVARRAPAGALGAVLRAETDRTNIYTALRLRAAMLAEGAALDWAPARERFLPGGWIPPEALDDAAHAGAPAVAAARLRHPAYPHWRAGLAAWAADGDLSALAEALDAASTRAAVRLFLTGDPLGVAVPVAFTWAKENEIRNLRCIGRGLVHGFPRAAIEERLVLAS